MLLYCSDCYVTFFFPHYQGLDVFLLIYLVSASLCEQITIHSLVDGVFGLYPILLLLGTMTQ